MSLEFCLFTITGAVVYYYAGQYSTAPGYGSLIEKYAKVAAGFTLPTIIIVGILYSLVTSRAILFQVSAKSAALSGQSDKADLLVEQIFPEGSRHRTRHTVLGWSTWICIVFGGWVVSFLIGEGECPTVEVWRHRN